MYVSAALKRLGHTVKVLNYNLYNYDFVSEVSGQDVVMFTGFEEFYKPICRDALVCKKLGIKTVVGGALATFAPEKMLQVCDTVVTGESDDTMDVALRKTGMVFGFAYKPGAIMPDYEGFGIDEYHRRHGDLRYMGVLATRGCPYACTFCAQTCKYSVRPLQNVMEEVDHYIDHYGISMVVFNDNTLNAEMKYFDELIAAMAERECEWSASIRLDNLTDDIVFRMRESGCRYLVVGVESFQQSRLDMMHKRITVGEITRGLDWLHNHGIIYHGNVLVGFEDETMADILKEIASIPSKYTVFPIRVRPFIGVKESCKCALTPQEKAHVDTTFKNYLERKGKYQYPDLPEMSV
jgi:radical SAM superfamily enzyme YgiQ (UPF0313 family)